MTFCRLMPRSSESRNPCVITLALSVLLKEVSKRRRTKAQIAADKLAEANREADIEAKLEKIEMVEHKLSSYDQLH